MAKQTFTTGQVLTAAQMTSLQQTAMLGGEASAKVASYTLVAADAGTAISMSNAGATTITVNTALFAAGDTVQITNLGAGVCTITAGTATVNTSASLALAQYESGTLDFTSTSAAIFIKGAGAAAASGGMTLLSTTTLSGATTTISAIDGTYKDLEIIISGITINTDSEAVTVRPNAANIAVYAFQVNATNDSATNEIKLSGGKKVANTGGQNAFSMNIYNYASTTHYKTFAWRGRAFETVVQAIYGGGSLDTTSAITSFEIACGGGKTFSGGQVLIYGVK